MKHTSSPWHVGMGKAEVIIYGENGYAVADAKVYHDKTPLEIAANNARLIVRAVNCHEQLVEALSETLKMADFSRVPCAEGNARAALAAAKGEM